MASRVRDAGLVVRKKFRKVVINEQRRAMVHDCLSSDVAAACDFRPVYRPRCLAHTGAVSLSIIYLVESHRLISAAMRNRPASLSVSLR
jgi:hypothetical protein